MGRIGYHLLNSVVGLVSVSVVTPLISSRIFKKWFSFPEVMALAPIPFITAIFILALYRILRHAPFYKDRYCWVPFVLTIMIYVLSFIGLVYSFFPYIIPEKMTIIEAAASPASLTLILIGMLIIFPILIVYTILAYYIFHGKAIELRYD